MKKITIIITAMLITLLSATFANTETAKPPIHIYVNGVLMEWIDAEPFFDAKERTMIPLSAVSKNLGAEVTWDANTSTAHVRLGDKDVSLQIGKNYGMVNGTKQEFDTVTVALKGRTYVPLGFVSTALGYDIRYRFGKDERANNENAHIIEIGDKSALTLIPRAELGWDKGFITLEESLVFHSKFKTVPAGVDVGSQIMTSSTAIMMARYPTSESMLFDPVIVIRLEPLNDSGKKEHISVGIGLLPYGWEEFLTHALEFMAGKDGLVIANDIIKTYKSVYDQEANIYRTSRLPKDLTVKSGRYTYNYSTGEINW